MLYIRKGIESREGGLDCRVNELLSVYSRAEHCIWLDSLVCRDQEREVGRNLIESTFRVYHLVR